MSSLITKTPGYELDRLIVDLSSVLRAAHYRGKDEEHGFSVEHDNHSVFVNGFFYAFENWVDVYKVLLSVTNTAPIQTVIVKDSPGSREVRQRILPAYKAHRKPAAPEINEQYNKAVDLVCKTVTDMGGVIVQCSETEADDVVAYLTKRLKGKKTVWTGDGDLLALQSDTTDVYYRGAVNPRFKTTPTPKYITLYKSLVGDTSDGMPGAKDFGDKAFFKLSQVFGLAGLDSLIDLIEKGKLNKLSEDVNEFKPLQKIIDGQDMVYASYRCAKFLIERVNTLKHPLQIVSGFVRPVAECRHSDLEEYYGTQYLIDANNYDSFYEAIVDGIAQSPYIAMDTEGSTPGASEKWLDALQLTGRNKKKRGFDSFGYDLDGMSITFGNNLQNTIYLPVNHIETANLNLQHLLRIVRAIPKGKRVMMHNTSFDLPLLHRAWGDLEHDNGFRGFVPNAWDTVIMQAYADENIKTKLKGLAKLYFDYDQVEYETVTAGKKMNEISAKQVTSYACDDTVITAAVANRTQFVMEIEDTISIFNTVEFFVQYVCAEAFNRGIVIDLDRLSEIEAEDDITYDAAWKVVKKYLEENKRPGTFLDVPDGNFPRAVKYIFKIVYGTEFKTRCRKPVALAEASRTAGASDEFCHLIVEGDLAGLTKLAEENFLREPEFLASSPKQVAKLLYDKDFMCLPIRLHSKPTDKMRAEGKHVGTPKADSNAIAHALKLDVEDGSKEFKVLIAMKKISEVATRRSLFYQPYRALVHWKDGRLHPNLGQSRAATRRFTPSGPNVNQLSKRGDGKRLRSIIIPDSDDQVVVSRDYDGQELVITADTSKDINMMGCYSGDSRTDVHLLTGSNIAKLLGLTNYDTYEKIRAAYAVGDLTAIQLRTDAKAPNFGCTYGITGQGIAIDLIISEEEGQKFIDAYFQAFPGVARWTRGVISLLRKTGHAYTRLGAIRHLQSQITSPDKWVQRRAERQAANYCIQGSAGEQTKIALSKSWTSGILVDSNNTLLFPLHDEIVSLMAKGGLGNTIVRLGEIMVEQYADMDLVMSSDYKAGPNFGELQ